MTVKVNPDRYVENEDYVPDPTNHFGTLDTSGTSGAADQSIREISPVFAVADHDAKVQAKRALDDNDEGVPRSSVVLPPDEGDLAEKAKKRVTEAGKNAEKEDVVIGGLTPAQQQAAEGGEDGESKPATEDARKASTGGSGGSKSDSDKSGKAGS